MGYIKMRTRGIFSQLINKFSINFFFQICLLIYGNVLVFNGKLFPEKWMYMNRDLQLRIVSSSFYELKPLQRKQYYDVLGLSTNKKKIVRYGSGAQKIKKYMYRSHFANKGAFNLGMIVFIQRFKLGKPMFPNHSLYVNVSKINSSFQ